MSVCQRKTLSISEQLELINDVKVKKLKLSAAAQKYGIGYSTAAKILKKEDDLRSYIQMNGNINRKRKRQSVHKEVNEALTQWFMQEACAHGATITNRVIKQKALQLAVNLKVDFKPSNGWLMRWKQANNLSFKKSNGELMPADQGFANEWVSFEVSESDDKPVPNSMAALNALETLKAYFQAKSSNPDGALKIIYGLYESVHHDIIVNKDISEP